MPTFNNPYGIGTELASYYTGALANDPRLPAINRNIAGQIAPDVRNQLGQSAAERGIGIGSYGAGNDQSSLLRALGLTSIGMTNQGISQYGDAYNSVPALNPASLFVNATDQAQLDRQREDRNFQDAANLRNLQLNIAAGAANQSAQIGSSERMQGNSLAASGSQFSRSLDASQGRFNQERSDALSALSSSNSRLQGIIDRNSGGGYGSGSGGGTTATGGGSSYSWGNWGAQPTIPSVDPVYYGSNSGYDGGFDNNWYDPYAPSPVSQPSANDFMYGLDEW